MVLLGIFGQMDFFARLFVFPGYLGNRHGKRGGKKMEAVIYTKSDKEYQSLSDILEKEAELESFKDDRNPDGYRYERGGGDS